MSDVKPQLQLLFIFWGGKLIKNEKYKIKRIHNMFVKSSCIIWQKLLVYEYLKNVLVHTLKVVIVKIIENSITLTIYHINKIKNKKR